MITNLCAVGALETSAGSVDVWRVTPAYSGAGEEIVGYVVVVRQPADNYCGPRVPMAVTVHDPSAAPGKAAMIAELPDQVPPGKWDGVTLLVDDVYADHAFRGVTGAEVSPPVAVGRFLCSEGRFEAPSALRSEAGDRWASRVGGDVPELLGRPTGDLEGHMQGWLEEVALDPRLKPTDQA